MSDAKLFAGPRIRRARQELGVTQAAMAQSLEISPSYLNLIERNQRPLTARVLLKLATTFDLDLDDLVREGGDEIAGLREAFTDPLLAGEISTPRELVDLADTVPNAAAGVVKLYRAYREALKRLSDLSGLLAEEGVAAPVAADERPFDRFRAIVEERPYHYAELDEAAEAAAEALPRGTDMRAALIERLARRGLAVRVMPVSAMPLWRVHHDRHTQRLLLSDALTHGEQLVALGAELVRAEAAGALDATVGDLTGDGGEELRRLVRAHAMTYGGQAVVMPYRRFREAAERTRHDPGALAARFDVGIEHAVRRLVSLQRINASAPPFFAMTVDGAGVLERIGSRGFPFARFGGACVKLPYDPEPGGTFRLVEMPDGQRYAIAAYPLVRPPMPHGSVVPRRAIMLGMRASDAASTAFASIVESEPLPIGLACRLCERQGCPVRAEPAITRAAGTDEWTVGATPWEFQ